MESDSNSDKPRRILLKISGEALMGKGEFGIDPEALDRICNEIKEIKKIPTEIGIVVGGGNIFRGVNLVGRGMDRVVGDNMGMLATVMNALAMMDTLEKMGIYTRVMSALELEAFAEKYIRRRAVRHM
ncbi:MAG: UMP kinase, partial [bacterium]|nr:UMP kinase [bacterium]